LTWRGRIEDPSVRLSPHKILGVSILSSLKEPSPFRMEIDWIDATTAQHFYKSKRYRLSEE
jgi:hypothetical protein